MQQRAGGQQILVRAVRRAQRKRRSGDREDVLEKPAPVGVVHRLRRRPDAQLLTVLRGDALQQLAHERVADVLDQLIELAPHLLDRTRRAQHAVFLAESLPLVLVGIDAADLLDKELHPPVEQIGPPLHFDEVAAVELFAKAGRFIEDARPHEAGPVLQRQRDEQVPAAPLPDVFLGAEKESPTGQFRSQHRIFGKRVDDMRGSSYRIRHPASHIRNPPIRESGNSRYN